MPWWLKISILLPTALVAVTTMAEGLAVNIELSVVILEGVGRPAVLRTEGQVIKRKH
jgi:hypothetical protein